jgi:hypothetical protein
MVISRSMCYEGSETLGMLARRREGVQLTVGTIASRILVEEGSGEHDASIREGFRVCSRRCGCLVFL